MYNLLCLSVKILLITMTAWTVFSQDSPQSNSIHIGHNNPVGSDIKIKQTKPFNTSVHISLKVGSQSKVMVEMTDAVNLMLHISFNGMTDSEVEVMVDKAYNSSVHVSFQNPVNTPVKVDSFWVITKKDAFRKDYPLNFKNKTSFNLRISKKLQFSKITLRPIHIFRDVWDSL